MGMTILKIKKPAQFWSCEQTSNGYLWNTQLITTGCPHGLSIVCIAVPVFQDITRVVSIVVEGLATLGRRSMDVVKGRGWLSHPDIVLSRNFHSVEIFERPPSISFVTKHGVEWVRVSKERWSRFCRRIATRFSGSLSVGRGATSEWDFANWRRSSSLFLWSRNGTIHQ